MTCRCADNSHPLRPPHNIERLHYFETCAFGWPLRDADGHRLLTHDGELLSLQLAAEDDTAEYVLEYLDRVRDSGALHERSLRRGLALEQIGPLAVLRISDDAFAAVAAALGRRVGTLGAYVSVNLNSTTLVVSPTSPRPFTR